MAKDILYFGDTALKEAASYLAGVMTNAGLTFDYLASDQKVSDDLLAQTHAAAVISDFPAANFTGGQLDRLARKVRDGMGLVMIGGWESFTGPNREYTATVLKDVLPVIMQETDDRVNCPQPCLIEKHREHPILENLPFAETPPGIGGFNRVQAKRDGVVLLSSRRFSVRVAAGEFAFQAAAAADPLLVVGSYGKGRTAAFASDVAPHWVGGLVDWGDGRVCAQGPGAGAIEVGNWYARFFANILRWAGGMI